MVNRSGQSLPSKRTILFVEDEYEIRATMSEFLRDQGYEVIEASNAEEALGALASGLRVDVVFADIMIPGATNGLSLARRIRSTHPEIRILLTSGLPVSLGLAAGLGEGHEILPKPYTLEVLFAHVEMACSRPQSHPRCRHEKD